MVEYAETMSPQRYVELITDLCCFFPEEKLVETMRDVLEENGYGHLKDYDFKDIKEVAESSAMFVLVELYPDENGHSLLRWFEIPEGMTAADICNSFEGGENIDY